MAVRVLVLMQKCVYHGLHLCEGATADASSDVKADASADGWSIPAPIAKADALGPFLSITELVTHKARAKYALSKLQRLSQMMISL